MAIPGLLLWIVDALALTLLLGAFCARFRDIQPIVNSVMQIMFFVTPVIWKPEQLGDGHGETAAQSVLRPAGDRARPDAGRRRSDRHGLAGGDRSLVSCCAALSWAFFVRARGRITFWI